MKATVLIDNIAKNELTPEWGLSIYIEYKDKKILLDTGASENFIKNAQALGINLSQADFAVLSHAHYDHANGMERFFHENAKAPFYLRQGSKENCYGKKFLFSKYIGLPRGILDKYPNRILFAQGDYEICPGVALIPHKKKGLELVGKKNGLYVRQGRHLVPDDFSHEQSLVFDTKEGLVIFNSCSHGGADQIIRETAETYPGKRIYGLIGGFHLFQMPEKEIRALADRIKKTGIQKVYTGHCTGKRAFFLLKEELKDRVHQLETGLVIELPESEKEKGAVQ